MTDIKILVWQIDWRLVPFIKCTFNINESQLEKGEFLNRLI